MYRLSHQVCISKMWKKIAGLFSGLQGEMWWEREKRGKRFFDIENGEVTIKMGERLD